MPDNRHKKYKAEIIIDKIMNMFWNQGLSWMPYESAVAATEKAEAGGWLVSIIIVARDLEES